MGYELRPIVAEELPAFAAADAAAFGWDMAPEDLDRIKNLLELDRTLATFDGPEIVSSTAIYSFEMTVPGGASLPAAGVTWVSVKPTHRRRGILREMMRRQLSDVRERGESFAALWASESIIYGRFGYGLAAEGVEMRIDRAHAALRETPPRRGRTRLVTREEALKHWPAVYDRVRASRPGMYARPEHWWQYKVMPDPEHHPDGFTGSFFVQYEENGEVLGYARYRRKGEDVDGLPAGVLRIQEVVPVTDVARAELWDYLFGVDLVGRIEAWPWPADEPLFHMLADSRRLVRRIQDALWVRIVDPVTALSSRRYSTEGSVVIGVEDDFCPWVAGTYEVKGGPEGAQCKPSSKAPEIRLGAAELGAVYLGGTSLETLARAGRVDGTEAAIRRADAMFQWRPLPWGNEIF